MAAQANSMDFGIPGLLANWRKRQQTEWSQRAAAASHTISPGGIPSAEAIGTPLLFNSPSPDHPDVILQATIVVLGDKANEGQIIRAVTIPWFEILREMERDPLFALSLTPRTWEEFIAGAYTRAGFSEVILTPSSHDKGRDVIATNSFVQIRIVDEVKLYAPGRLVTPETVRALAGVLLRDQNVSKGFVTTTSRFSPGVFDEWKSLIPYRLDLRDGKKLQEWLMTLKEE